MKGFAALAVWGLMLAPCSSATFLNNSTGLAGPKRVITFSEIVLPPDTEILSIYSGLGVTFSPGVLYNPTGLQGTPYPNIDSFLAGNGGINHAITSRFSIFFAKRSSAAFALATQGGATTIFEALLDGVVQESASRVTTYTSSQNYFGFTGILFNELRITEIPGTPDENGSVAFDNIQLGCDATVSPCITNPPDGATPGSAYVALSGVGTSGETVDIIKDGSPVTAVIVEPSGTWEAVVDVGAGPHIMRTQYSGNS
jgi:hypothetical protein